MAALHIHYTLHVWQWQITKLIGKFCDGVCDGINGILLKIQVNDNGDLFFSFQINKEIRL